jgi:hypothetical protein
MGVEALILHPEEREFAFISRAKAPGRSPLESFWHDLSNGIITIR